MSPKERLFFYKNGDYETCFNLDYFTSRSLDDKSTFEIIGAKIQYGSGCYFCSFHGEVGEAGDGCGKSCKEYTPRNGKNGRCKHSNNCYSPEGETYIIESGILTKHK